MKLKYIVLMGSLITATVIKVEPLEKCTENAKDALQESLMNKMQNWGNKFFETPEFGNVKKIFGSFKDTIISLINPNNALPKNEQPNPEVINFIQKAKGQFVKIEWGKKITLMTTEEFISKLKELDISQDFMRSIGVRDEIFNLGAKTTTEPVKAIEPANKKQNIENSSMVENVDSENVFSKMGNFLFEAAQNPFMWAAVGLMIFGGYALYKQEFKNQKKRKAKNSNQDDILVISEEEFLEIMLSEDIDF